MEFNRIYYAEGTGLARFIDSAVGIDMDCNVNYTLAYSFSPAEGMKSDFEELKESTVKARVLGAAKIACMLLCPSGIEMTSTAAPLPEEAFLSDMRGRLNDQFRELCGAEIATLELKSQSVADPEAEQWNRLLERHRLASDPQLAAEEMLRKSGFDPALIGTVHVSDSVSGPFEPLLKPEPAMGPSAPRTVPLKSGNRWVCACGRENTSNFCPDCGSKKNLSLWICVCGSRNTGKFCPECGNPADS